MNRTAPAFASIVLILTSVLRAQAPAQVSLDSLLSEMLDRSRLARFPDPPFQLREASSHDRHKVDPRDPAGWHSNNDHEQFIRVEDHAGRREWVMMEDSGPGAITRFWTPLWADLDKSILRIYLDGSDQPAIEANFNELMSGRGFVRPPLAFIAWDQTDLRDELKPTYQPIRGVAGDLYLPMPYAHGCKVTLDHIPFYDVINYRHYADGVSVRSFDMKNFSRAAATVRCVGDLLMLDTLESVTPALKPLTVDAGQRVELSVLDGASAIERLKLKIEPKDESALRTLILEAVFDDEPTIWSPLGEFFGCGPRLRAVSDSNRSVLDDGTMICRWIMPFQKKARLSLHNLGPRAVPLQYAVRGRNWTWDDRSLHFHATWRSQHDLKTRPFSDWNYLVATGTGQYVGDTLSVYSPVAAWYGEGDERIYIDGEKLPSHLGTGTEDYYGFAWGMPDYFNSPFLSAPKRDLQNRDDWTGYTTTSRLRGLDAIPFKTSLRHDMEIWNWADTQVDYAVTSFWYARPGATSNREPQPGEAIVPIKPAPLDPSQSKIAGAIECESMKVAAQSPGLHVEVQAVPSLHWSGGKQLFVMATQTSDFIELEIPCADPHPQTVTLYGTRSYDYAKLNFSLNGQAQNLVFDGYAQQPQATGRITIGSATPAAGLIRLRVQPIGANPSATPGKLYFGLDCVVLTPAK